MKFLFLLAMISQVQALDPQTKTVNRVSRLDWDGSQYKVQLNNFQKQIVISGSNEMVPCLENAYKAQMQILVVIDTDIPMIKSCALYSPGLIKETIQAQEEPVDER